MWCGSTIDKGGRYRYVSRDHCLVCFLMLLLYFLFCLCYGTISVFLCSVLAIFVSYPESLALVAVCVLLLYCFGLVNLGAGRPGTSPDRSRVRLEVSYPPRRIGHHASGTAWRLQTARILPLPRCRHKSCIGTVVPFRRMFQICQHSQGTSPLTGTFWGVFGPPCAGVTFPSFPAAGPMFLFRCSTFLGGPIWFWLPWLLCLSCLSCLTVSSPTSPQARLTWSLSPWSASC